MRLDVYLVERGYFSTRQKAKEAIKRGFVRVNGAVARKPSKDVRGDEMIEVACEEKPRGYWKLKEIDEAVKLFSGVRDVLDIGSSAGGFLLYSAERCELAVGLEFSREFLEQLKDVRRKAGNVEVIIGDAYSIELRGKFDLILIDVTTDVENSIRLARRFLGNLREGGKMLVVLKGIDADKARELDFELAGDVDGRMGGDNEKGRITVEIVKPKDRSGRPREIYAILCKRPS